MQNKVLLGLGVVLLCVGWFKPDLSSFINSNPVVPGVSCVVDAPSDDQLLEKSRAVVDILKSSNDSTRKNDCTKLSSLYCDMALLIELDAEDVVIKDTASIKEANSLAGKMLKLNIKDKYEGLAEAAKELLVSSIGEDDVALDEELRSKAVDAFRALSWAFYQGSK
jgi:hypothetical protein